MDPSSTQGLGRGGVARDAMTDGCGARERNRTDPGVGGQGRADVCAAGHHLHRRRGAAGVAERSAEDVGEPQRREWRLRSRLAHDRAARGDRRGDLVGGEQERVVEAGDPYHGADRHAGPEAEEPLARGEKVEGDRLTVDPRDLLGSGLQRGDGTRDLGAAVDERLARLVHEEVLEGSPCPCDAGGCLEEHRAPHVGGKGRGRRFDTRRRVDCPRRLRHGAGRRFGDLRLVEREEHGRRGARDVPAVSDREPRRERERVDRRAHGASVSRWTSLYAGQWPASVLTERAWSIACAMDRVTQSAAASTRV